MTLAGRVALITGGAQGLGRAICEALLQKGARVCIADFNETVGQKCLQELNAKHGAGAVEFAKCDVTRTEDLEAAFQKTKAKFGKIDILANNAGIGVDTNSQKVVDVNLNAVINGTHLGIKHMGKNNGGEGGVIINTASMAAFLIAPQAPAYCATKAGVMMFSRCMGFNLHFKKHGVRVNCICPSFSPTALLDQVLKDEFVAKLVKATGTVSPELVAEGFSQLVEDTSKNGAVMRITAQKGIDYKKFPEDYAKERQTNSKL